MDGISGIERDPWKKMTGEREEILPDMLGPHVRLHHCPINLPHKHFEGYGDLNIR